jgi:hypothetical protein
MDHTGRRNHRGYDSALPSPGRVEHLRAGLAGCCAGRCGRLPQRVLEINHEPAPVHER